MINLDKTIVISGNSQNTGKTTLTCRIISENKDKNFTAIKISPHFHKLTSNLNIIEQVENQYVIAEEKDKNSQKDSSLMLKAGAGKVYYVQTKDEFLPKVLEKLNNIIDDNSYVIFESGGVIEFINPAIHIFLIKENDIANKTKNISKQTQIINSFSDEYFQLARKIFT